MASVSGPPFLNWRRIQETMLSFGRENGCLVVWKIGNVPFVC